RLPSVLQRHSLVGIGLRRQTLPTRIRNHHIQPLRKRPELLRTDRKTIPLGRRLKPRHQLHHINSSQSRRNNTDTLRALLYHIPVLGMLLHNLILLEIIRDALSIQARLLHDPVTHECASAHCEAYHCRTSSVSAHTGDARGEIFTADSVLGDADKLLA